MRAELSISVDNARTVLPRQESKIGGCERIEKPV
jgi:hypothetical protein